MDTPWAVGFMVFMAGVIFAAGKLSARVDAHDDRLHRIESEVDQIFEAIREVRDIVRGDKK